jgi:hypothetical protein
MQRLFNAALRADHSQTAHDPDPATVGSPILGTFLFLCLRRGTMRPSHRQVQKRFIEIQPPLT